MYKENEEILIETKQREVSEEQWQYTSAGIFSFSHSFPLPFLLPLSFLSFPFLHCLIPYSFFPYLPRIAKLVWASTKLRPNL